MDTQERKGKIHTRQPRGGGDINGLDISANIILSAGTPSLATDAI